MGPGRYTPAALGTPADLPGYTVPSMPRPVQRSPCPDHNGHNGHEDQTGNNGLNPRRTKGRSAIMAHSCTNMLINAHLVQECQIMAGAALVLRGFTGFSRAGWPRCQDVSVRGGRGLEAPFRARGGRLQADLPLQSVYGRERPRPRNRCSVVDSRPRNHRMPGAGILLVHICGLLYSSVASVPAVGLFLGLVAGGL